MKFTLEYHRTADAPNVWHKLRTDKDVYRLALRARRLAKLWKKRPQDGVDEVRVVSASGKIASYYDVKAIHKPGGRVNWRKERLKGKDRQRLSVSV